MGFSENQIQCRGDFGSALRIVRGTDSRPRRGVLAFIISGAGGWIGFDRRLARSLGNFGIDIMGVDARRYFLWKQRDPDEIAAAVGAVLQSQSKHWHDDRLILIGYSQGADIMPFIARRLGAELQRRVSLIVLLGAAPAADFKLRLRDVIFGTYTRRAQPLLPELQALDAKKILCFWGLKDKSRLRPEVLKLGAAVHMVPGGHIFRHHDGEIAHTILEYLDRSSDQAQER